MPELPDIAIYIEALESRILDEPLQAFRLASPFLLRSVQPPFSEVTGKKVIALQRLGKRIVFRFEGGVCLVLHLMIAGRLHWKEPGAKLPGRMGLAAFDFPPGTLTLTEASSKKRAGLHVARAEDLPSFDRGGLEVLESSLGQFRDALFAENHTLKRSLTDPRLFSGIGNAYSDEILHRARLSPLRLSRQLQDGEVAALFEATRGTLLEWISRLRKEAGGQFPEHVTAFRKDMAVHGRFGLPCPTCGTRVQRIVYAENEANYCPRCQTGGKLLADRSLSRLLKDDWPRSIEELEAQKRSR
jgi:formamidopyrimidine-DNA glycosylase